MATKRRSINKRSYLKSLEIITDRKAPPRKTNPKSFYRDLVGGMTAGDWCVVDEVNKQRLLQGIIKYARGRYSLYQHPEQAGQYIFTITK
jgi:hypothetical protein|tara:strand:+ start:130 stop:399 length:270 start_codon:yes stop_codon:yes gene_type:complete